MDSNWLVNLITYGNPNVHTIEELADRIYSKNLMPTLFLLLGSRYNHVRAKTASLLEKLGDESGIAFVDVFYRRKEESIPRLFPYLKYVENLFKKSVKNTEVRLLALKTIGRQRRDRSMRLRVLEYALKDSSHKVKFEAVNLIRESPGRDERLILRDILGDSDQDVVREAAEILAMSRNSMSSMEVGYLLQKFKETGKYGYALALVLMGKNEGINAFGIAEVIKAIGEPLKGCRDAAAGALRESEDPVVKAFLDTFYMYGNNNTDELQSRVDIVEELAKSSYPYTRIKAINVLERLSPGSSIPLFLAALRSSDRGVRMAGITALGKFADSNVLLHLRTLLEKELNEGIKAAAEDAIRDIEERCGIAKPAEKPDDTVPEELNCIDGNCSVFVDGGLGDALHEFTMREQHEKNPSEEFVFLGNALKSPERRKREAALEIIEDMGRLQRMELLVDALSSRQGGKDAIIKIASHRNDIGDLHWNRIMNMAVSGTDIQKENSIILLGELGDKRAMELLSRSMDDSSERVRAAAVKTIAGFGDADAVDRIIDSFCDTSIMVQNEAVLALSRLKNMVGLDQIKRISEFIEKGSEELAKNCVVALCMVGEIALPDLFSALENSNASVRLMVVKNIRIAVESEVAVDAVKKRLKAVLEDSDPEVAAEATTQLGVLKDYSSVRSLILKLGSDDEKVSSGAAKALESMGSTTGKLFVGSLLHGEESAEELVYYPDLLDELAKSSNPGIRKAAEVQLEKINQDPELKRKYEGIMREKRLEKARSSRGSRLRCDDVRDDLKRISKGKKKIK